jgi:hypothetical protein
MKTWQGRCASDLSEAEREGYRQAYDEWLVLTMAQILTDAAFVGASTVSCRKHLGSFVVKAEGLTERKQDALAEILRTIRGKALTWTVIS